MNLRNCWLTGAGLSAALILAPGAARAQTDAYESYKREALRFAQVQATGTTRTQSMGGAGSALGADLGAFVLNPANLGSYHRSEVSLSPGLLINKTESAAGLARQPLTGASDDGRGGFNFANFGVVIVTSHDEDGGDWRSGAVGINFSRLATLSNQRTYALNVDSAHSIQEYIVQDFALPFPKGNGSIDAVLDNFGDNLINNFADLGYNTYLLNFGYDSLGKIDGSFSTPRWNSSRARQTETTEMRGAVNQIDIGYGASYRDRLYVGGSLGIVTMRYQQTRTLEETLGATSANLQSIRLRDGYEVNGAGVNLRIGVVYRPMDMVRLGLAIQTPTFASELKEQADEIKLSTVFRQPVNTKGDKELSASIAASEFAYSLTTPFRATGGVALIFKSNARPAADGQPATGGSIVGGLISADIDYVNYGQARLTAISNDPANANFSAANASIKREYASAINYRLGAELRLGDFRLRGGYGRYGTPYKTTSRGEERTVIGGGVGIRRERGYLDIGFSRTTYTMDPYSPYSLTTFNNTRNDYDPYAASTAAEPVVRTTVTLLNPTITVGFIIQ